MTPFNTIPTRASAKAIVTRLFLAMVLLQATGCVLLRASPHRATAFLPIREEIDNSTSSGPFQGLLFINQEKFNRLNQPKTQWYIAPINMDMLITMIHESSLSGEKKIERLEEIQEIARFTKLAFEHHLQSNDQITLKISTRPIKKGITLELALVEVEPTSPIINIIATVAGFFVPGGSLIGTFGSGSIAIEGIVRDASTKKILLEFKDREKDKIAPFTIKDFQRYAHLREAIQDWAELFARFVASNGSSDISPPLPFTLNPL